MDEQSKHSSSSAQPDPEEQFLKERLERWGQEKRNAYDPFVPMRPRKNKWISGLLSFLVPGTGQLYLGLMQRGLGIMLLFMLDIFAIVFFSVNGADSIPLIVLFSLLLPVMYFYNIFDALQQTDRVNGWGSGGEPPAGDAHYASVQDPMGQGERPFRKISRGNSFGYILIIAGIVLFLAAGRPAWLDTVIRFLGSTFGALILIGAGVAIFIRESIRK